MGTTGIVNVSPSMNKAYGCGTTNEFIVTITEIILQPEGTGPEMIIWSGNEVIDLTQLTSLAAIKNFNANIPTGKYSGLRIKSKTAQVTGTVTVSSITYYTKAAHTGFATGPAEREALSPDGATINASAGIFSLEQIFTPAITIGSSVKDIYLLFDFSKYLVYYNGNNDTDHTGAQMPASMHIGYLPFAFCLGAPGSREVYEYSVPGVDGYGRLTLMFDSTGKMVGGSCRPILENSKGKEFGLWGILGQLGIGGGSDSLVANGNGTYTLTMNKVGGTVTFSQFARSNHTGSYTYPTAMDMPKSGSYTCTRVE
jgi:hypothetical protein